MTIPVLLMVAISLWLTFAGIVMAVNPRLALTVVSRAGSTVGLQWLEHTLRFLAGAVLILASPESRVPDVLLVIGWFLALTSILILALPRNWHHAYALWCARVLPAWLVRALAPVSVLAAGALLWAVL